MFTTYIIVYVKLLLFQMAIKHEIYIYIYIYVKANQFI